MATLKEIREKLQASNQQKSGQGSGGDNQIFPHWNAAEGTTTTVRFLPDADPNNTFFWIERNLIKLPFAGVKGETNSKPVIVQVPCMEMWGEHCPVLSEVRPWYKDESLKSMADKYWKKKSYLFQGLVIDSKLQEDKVPENPIRRFVISSQIFNIVKNALMDSEIDELPTDYVRGLDFKIVKTSKGAYADYSTSTWARRERALSETELAAISQHGLYNLKEFLPKKPGDVELRVIKEMFEASVDGEAYDPARWSQYFKPSGYNSTTTSESSSSASSPAPTSYVAKSVPAESPLETTVVEKAEAKPSSGDAGSRAADIISMIRSRQKQ